MTDRLLADAHVQLICMAPSLVITSVKKTDNRNPFYPFLAPAGGAAPKRRSSSASSPTPSSDPHQLVTWLLELLFYSSSPSAQRFLSYVETQHEVSIVFEAELLERVPRDALEVEPIRWKALQVASAGAGAFLSQLAILTELTTQLARHDISVFQISTYQTDYILVKSEDLDRAIQCLLGSFCDVEMENGEPYTPTVETEPQQPEEREPRKDTAAGEPPRKHTLSAPDLDLHLVEIDKASVRRHMFALVRLLFGQSRRRRRAECEDGGETEADAADDACGKLFLSYSETGDGISIVTSDLAFLEQMEELARDGEEGVMVSPDSWRVVQIGDENLGFNETGIVASHTSVLLNAGTMVFYLSTYATDFMLIKEDEWSDALQILRANFRLLEGQFAPIVDRNEQAADSDDGSSGVLAAKSEETGATPELSIAVTEL
ncbi:hypothetical protein P43SY_000565 [Pythium insidiosum]|uniref:CASTOR ACT domain-containing protein n=1 Tax=Pythium insidiosum TaxID=114742 RepID=A0AAD5Q6K2_PYTIN|nr:hypothetical protein P43SY_000565 [Pythium insidiosum]